MLGMRLWVRWVCGRQAFSRSGHGGQRTGAIALTRATAIEASARMEAAREENGCARADRLADP